MLCCCLGRDLRLIEVTETICKRLLDYSLHKERTGSNRFAKVGFVYALPPRGPRLRGSMCPLVWVPSEDHTLGASLLGSSLFFIHCCLHPSRPEWPDFSVRWAHS